MNMYQLGNTRSAHRADHLLQTPDTFVRAPFPGMRNATAIVHIGPASGAQFTQYTVEFEPRGFLDAAAPSVQRFIYVLDGELEGAARSFAAGDYAYFPAGGGVGLTAPVATLATIIEKPYEPLVGTQGTGAQTTGVQAPRFFTGREGAVGPQPLLDDPWIEVRTLVPADFPFDFAVNTMTYLPGATLPMVEIHVMEHGLLMLAGSGIYRLGEHWYPVSAGDFIWMAPYCPQWFGALGKTPAKYLIYKDWNRHPLRPKP